MLKMILLLGRPGSANWCGAAPWFDASAILYYYDGVNEGEANCLNWLFSCNYYDIFIFEYKK